MCLVILVSLSLSATAASAMPTPAPRPAIANNELACDLYSHLAASPGNLCFSPPTIGTALAMTLAGARGPTADEMAAVLHRDIDGHAAAGEFQRQLAARGPDLRLANRLWVQRGLPLQPEFRDICVRHFSVSVGELDFDGGREGAWREIDAWASEQTGGKVPVLVGADGLSRGTGLVLTSAVHFRGQWRDPFARDAAAAAPFWLTGGAEIPVVMMRQSRGFSYAETATAQALRLPYAGGRQVCEIYLPRERDGLAALEAQLDLGWLDSWVNLWRPRTVTVTIPPFSFSARYDLGPPLAAMGMALAFTADADFSGLATADGLAIDRVLHAAVVAVDEEGTEAAAGTSVGLSRGLASPESQPVAFTADHPFLFVIRDTETGAVLFLGRLADPRG